MVSLLSKGAPLCLCSHILALCNYDWNPASDREIATFCFSPYIQCLKKKKKKPEKCTPQKLYSSINHLQHPDSPFMPLPNHCIFLPNLTAISLLALSLNLLFVKL